ncbi:AMP-dependent synthetase/ligase [Aminipila luticellarii]|uniref:Long-chain fatty acid--CoA ligase n=1 Tax=Aminipila luticellarii TaxID=2507160 RepID=A0A410PXK8_9FIRM|nr:AMP-binding protein [Aminipila luticellarii]QAT43688.1 long-chain fatty acid--CoA ligase [Aminipila luticellarii]
MNDKKYKDVLYEFREISDLKDMVDSSAELFSEKDAYLVKQIPGGEYTPIKYRKFKEDIDALGTKFIEMGLKGKKIAVVGENSYKWIVTYLAATNGTGVIVPLDRELPPREMANLIERAEVSTIVYSKKMEKIMADTMTLLAQPISYRICMEKAEESGVYNLDDLIEQGCQLIAQGDRSFIDAEIDREAMCSLLFTSGTTGLAKGVMLSHKNISANVYNMSKYVSIPYEDFGLSVLPMHHSYELTCHIFTGIYQGMTVAICEGLKHILKNMQEAPAGVMLGVPLVFESMYKKILKQAQASGKLSAMKKMMAVSKTLKLYNHPKIVKKMFKDVHNAMGNHMNLFIAGGAAIDPSVIENFQALGIPMIQGYGMTENAPIIAVNKDRYSKPAAVGLPMPGTEIKIIDADKTGVGEIICRGDSVMIGYYNNPEETEQVLIDGWLHTGDYGYFDKDGFLYVCGRKKSVIVTKNGKNIFPEEVEFYLTQSEFIEEALVHGILDEKSGDTVVKAEVYLDREAIKEAAGELSTGDLRKFVKQEIDRLNEQMPLYKRVKRFGIRENEFEKTTTRKIKRFNQSNIEE